MNQINPVRHPFEISEFLNNLHAQSPQAAFQVLTDIATLPNFKVDGVESIDYRVHNAAIYTFNTLKAQKEFERKLNYWDGYLVNYSYKELGPEYPFADSVDPSHPLAKNCFYRTIITLDSAQLDPPFFDEAHFFHNLVNWCNIRIPVPKDDSQPFADKGSFPDSPPALIRASTNPSPIG